MKYFYQIAYCFFFLIFGLSCTSEAEPTENIDEQYQVPACFSLADEYSGEVRVQSSIGYTTLEECTSLIAISAKEEKWENKTLPPAITQNAAGNSTSTWLTNDQVGIYMRSALGGTSYYDKSNIPYKIVAGGGSLGTLTPPSTAIYFPHHSINTKFYAYYPYSASADNSLSTISYTLPANQSSPARLGAADIMCSNTPTANGASPNVSLNFNHKMVMLSFKINTSFLPATLAKITVSGQNVTNTGTLNLTTATTTPSTTSTFAPFCNANQIINPSTYANIDIIINPCTISSNENMSKLKVTLSFNGLIDHSTNLDISKTFISGTRYIYNLTVQLSM